MERTMTEREQLPDTTAAWTIYQSTSGGGDEFYCANNAVQSGTRPDGVDVDDITSERYGNTVYCRAPGIAPPAGKVPFDFTVERNGANNEETLVAACEVNPVIDGTRPSDYAHEVWFQSDSNVIRCFGYGTPPPPPDLYAVGDPGHIQAHADLVASVNEELDRFGLGDPLPIKEEGDEAHLDDHNAIRAKLETLETLAGQTFTHGLPPVRSLGDPSHTDDHNMLAWAVSEVKGWAAWNAATGGTMTTLEDGEYPLEGRWAVHTFTGSGTFTVTRGAQPFRVALGAGGGGGGYSWHYGWTGGRGGRGQTIVNDSATLNTGDLDVVVGGGGGNSAKGGTSSIDGNYAADGGGGAGGAGDGYHGSAGSPNYPGVTSDITGTSGTFPAGAGGAPGAANGGYGKAGGTGRVVIAYRIG
jgi:hypothetical protein